MSKIELNLREPCACGSRTYGCWEKQNWKFKKKSPDNPKSSAESAAWYSFDAEAYGLWMEEAEKNPCSKQQSHDWVDMASLPPCYLHGVPILIAKKVEVFNPDMEYFTGSVWSVEMAMWQITGNTRKSKKGVWLHTNGTELEDQQSWTHWMDLPGGPND